MKNKSKHVKQYNNINIVMLCGQIQTLLSGIHTYHTKYIHTQLHIYTIDAWNIHLRTYIHNTLDKN